MGFIETIRLLRSDKNQATPIIVSIAAATAVVYTSFCIAFAHYGRKKNQNIKEIPMPGSSFPYIGHLLSLGELPGKTISKWHQQLGPIIQLQMGRQTWITVCCPILAHKIFVTCGAETSYRPYAVFTQDYHSMKGKGLAFSQPGASWKKCRSSALLLLAPKHIHSYLDTIHSESNNLVDSLIACTENENSVNPIEYLELNSLNIISTASFGRRFESIHDPKYKEIASMVKTSLKLAGLEDDWDNYMPALSMLGPFIGMQAKMRRFIQWRNPFVLQLVKEATAKEGTNLVKTLQENGSDLSEEETIVLMFDIVTGGLATISIAINWAIAILCHFPKVQETISTEIDSFIRIYGHLPSFEDRNHLPYCISVIKECMRYRPITPFGAPHSVQEDIEIDGYIIPKGCVLTPNNYSLHQDPVKFPQPEQFIPERFMNNTKTMQSTANGKLEDRDHFNFGWGRRLCPGVYLAEVEIFTSLVQIFARCSIKPVSESRMPDIEGAVNAGLVLSPLPFKVKFLKRINAVYK